MTAVTAVTADSEPTTRDDAGFSIVEQIVTVAILGVVLAIVFTFLINATMITGRADANVKMEQNGLIALRTMTEDLRSARVLSTCSSTQTYDKCVNIEISKATVAGATCPKRVVQYYVSGTDLKMTLNEYAANCTTVTKSGTRILLAGVQTSSIFTYYGNDGVTAINLSTDAAKVPQARAVKVAFDVQYRKAAKNVSLSSVASLRNNR